MWRKLGCESPWWPSAVNEHLAYAMAGKVLDIFDAQRDVRDPASWCAPELLGLWSSGDADASSREPCSVCGEAEGYSHIVIYDACERPYHLQCLSPPRSVVPDGAWYCHLCDEAFSNLDKFCRPEDPLLFPRLRDPCHP